MFCQTINGQIEINDDSAGCPSEAPEALLFAVDKLGILSAIAYRIL
jgi:hypothetical protein